MPSDEPNSKWHFSSTDSMLTAFLEFTKIILADDYAELGKKIRLPAGGCRVKFTPEKEIFHKAFLFEQGCNIHGEQPQTKRRAKPQNSSVKRDGNAKTEGQIAIQIDEEEQKEGQSQPKQQSAAAEESQKEKGFILIKKIFWSFVGIYRGFICIEYRHRNNVNYSKNIL
jgi:hypothetical protein